MSRVRRDGRARFFRTVRFGGVLGDRRLHALRQYHVHARDDGYGPAHVRGGVQNGLVRSAPGNVLGGDGDQHRVDTERRVDFLPILHQVRGGKVDGGGKTGEGHQRVRVRSGRLRSEPHVLGPLRRRRQTLRLYTGNVGPYIICIF